ncbi:MAG TPA: DNA polymerase III subunit delta' [Gemmatales bacterium]|mgnify:CR=1 FL=1|nr:DNA polymerase III subunit delta' [Gemmatales bacterium]HMP58206.1 DNA polymerase III subunit delta' [Gemmatales bacterium]
MSWASIRGHRDWVQAFQQVHQQGKLAHAYAFLGPSGVGKRRFAFELAKALCCEQPPNGDLEACDRCPACLQVEAGMHPDVSNFRLPEDKQEFPIALIQELIQALALKPARGGRKVVIVDDADLFNEEAANCALKTLEEPPPQSLLILIGVSGDHFLATILSRCQQIRFGPLPDADIRDLLVAEGAELPADQWPIVLGAARGSLGQARLLLDDSVRQFRSDWLARWAGQRLDSVALAEKLVKFVAEAGKEGAAKRQRAALIVGFLTELFETALRFRLLGVPAGQGASPTGVLAQRLEATTLSRLIDRCLEAEHHIERRLQLDLSLEAWVDALAQEMSGRGP